MSTSIKRITLSDSSSEDNTSSPPRRRARRNASLFKGPVLAMLTLLQAKQNPMLIVNNYLTPREVKQIINLIDEEKVDWSRSYTDTVSDNVIENVINQDRTSSTAPFPVSNIGRSLVNKLLHSFCGADIELQLVKYDGNKQFFHLHHDEVSLDDDNNVLPVTSRNPRTLTYFVYLNTIDQEDGGQTVFPLFDLGEQEVNPVAGTAAVFPNVTASSNGRGYDAIQKTIHEARPVSDGIIKYGLNIWIHALPPFDEDIAATSFHADAKHHDSIINSKLDMNIMSNVDMSQINIYPVSRAWIWLNAYILSFDNLSATLPKSYNELFKLIKDSNVAPAELINVYRRWNVSGITNDDLQTAMIEDFEDIGGGRVDLAINTIIGFIKDHPSLDSLDDDTTLNLFILASGYGYLNVVKYLLERIGKKATILSYGNDALVAAIRNGHLEVVKYFLDEQHARENANIRIGYNDALVLAANYGKLVIVKYLLDDNRPGEKADIHTRNDEALRLAARNGRLAVVKYLLDDHVGEKAKQTAIPPYMRLPADIKEYLDDRRLRKRSISEISNSHLDNALLELHQNNLDTTLAGLLQTCAINNDEYSLSQLNEDDDRKRRRSGRTPARRECIVDRSYYVFNTFDDVLTDESLSDLLIEYEEKKKTIGNQRGDRKVVDLESEVVLNDDVVKWICEYNGNLAMSPAFAFYVEPNATGQEWHYDFAPKDVKFEPGDYLTLLIALKSVTSGGTTFGFKKSININDINNIKIRKADIYDAKSNKSVSKPNWKYTKQLQANQGLLFDGGLLHKGAPSNFGLVREPTMYVVFRAAGLEDDNQHYKTRPICDTKE